MTTHVENEATAATPDLATFREHWQDESDASYLYGILARLEKDRTTLVKPGDVSLLVPEVDEIHAMDNFSDRATVEVHVYGHDLVGLPRYRFDMERKQIIPFASEKFDNC